jgi:hypothetical protein
LEEGVEINGQMVPTRGSDAIVDEIKVTISAIDGEA